MHLIGQISTFDGQKMVNMTVIRPNNNFAGNSQVVITGKPGVDFQVIYLFIT